MNAKDSRQNVIMIKLRPLKWLLNQGLFRYCFQKLQTHYTKKCREEANNKKKSWC